ncbi:MAG: glycine hydroxymethyltransferase, partial [Thermomicrobiales bacterium]
MTASTRQASRLLRYLDGRANGAINPAAAAVYATLDHLGTVAPTVADAIVQEFRDQRTNLKL